MNYIYFPPFISFFFSKNGVNNFRGDGDGSEKGKWKVGKEDGRVVRFSHRFLPYTTSMFIGKDFSERVKEESLNSHRKGQPHIW